MNRHDSKLLTFQKLSKELLTEVNFHNKSASVYYYDIDSREAEQKIRSNPTGLINYSAVFVLQC